MDCWLPKIRSGLAQLPRWAKLIAGMIDLLKLLGGLLVGVFRSHAAREAEMAFLRQQLVVLQRSVPARLRLRTADRLIFVWLYRLFPSLLEAAVVFKPVQTALRATHPASGAATTRLDQCDSKSNRRVDRPPDHRSIPMDEAPRYLIRDRDTSYGAAVTRRLRAMGIRDRPITARSPLQNGHVERLIGSIRRECLDHVVVLGERHLRHLLANYATYYNGVHTHLALDKETPLHRPAQTVGRIASVTWLGGLHRHYVRMA